MTSGGRHSGRTRPLPLGVMLAAGITDSTGLAFGWTVFLLVVTSRAGLSGAALQSAAMLAGIALSAPFSAWLSSRLSSRDLLRLLAVAEGCCRLGLFLLLWADVDVHLIALLVALTNVLAWTGFAAMRSEVSRAEETAGRGRLLTWYAVAIAASEAMAAAAASVLLVTSPPPVVMATVALVYTLSLTPQWLVGTHADAARQPRVREGERRLPFRRLSVPWGVGAGVYVLAAGPALLATVLAYQRYGAVGVVVSAVAFAGCSLGATQVQAVVGRWQPTALSAFTLAAVMVAGWSQADRSLIWLAVAQGCAGVAQCSLEGDLDARTMARLPTSAPAGVRTTALAFASSSRALGGALAVGVLPTLIDRASLTQICSVSAVLLTVGALASAAFALRRIPAYVVGFAIGRFLGRFAL
jgi:hypothetical protein